MLDGDPASPQNGHSSPLFSAHVYCGHGRPSELLLSSCSCYNKRTAVYWLFSRYCKSSQLLTVLILSLCLFQSCAFCQDIPLSTIPSCLPHPLYLHCYTAFDPVSIIFVFSVCTLSESTCPDHQAHWLPIPTVLSAQHSSFFISKKTCVSIWSCLFQLYQLYLMLHFHRPISLPYNRQLLTRCMYLAFQF